MIYIATAADSVYYTCTLSLIGSIYRTHKTGEFEISIYDIGLRPDQRENINRLPGVKILDVERTNEQILTRTKKHPNGQHRTVPGSYSWKPVCVKMESDKHDQFLWMDAGTIAIRSLRPLWEHTAITGHFFMGTGSVGWMTPQTLAERLNLDNLFLSRQGLNSGIMGISKSIVDNFVTPCYQMTFDVNNFIDDGTAWGGDSAGRHDQTIFSIFALKADLPIHPNGNQLDLITRSGIVEASIPYQKHEIRDNTIIYHCRQDGDYMGDLTTIRKKYNL